MFTVKVYQYNTGLSHEFMIGGYNYSLGSWYNIFAINLTDSGSNYTVRYGYDSTSDCVWIGETNTGWTYPQVFVTDFQGGYGGADDGWATGWAISFATSFDTVEASRTASLGLNTNNYNSYSPTLTGTGASGTWGIRVSGFANAGTPRLYASDSPYNYDGTNPYYMYMTYDGSRWLLQVSPASPSAVRVAYADTANTVSSITGNTGLMVNRLTPTAFIDSMTSTTFRSYVFGTSSNGAAISAARWNSVPAPLSGMNQYGTLIGWSGESDTHGFLAMDYISAIARIGGGNGNNINWSAWLLHSSNFSSYALPLTGGTLTGPLAGTSASFSSSVTAGSTVLVTGTVNSAAGSFAIDHAGVNTWRIGITNSNTSTFSIGNDNGGSFATKVLNITNAGNVGIGTTSPAYKLVIGGSGHAFSVSPHANGIDIHSTGNIAPHYQTTFTWYTGEIGSGVLRASLNASGTFTAQGDVVAFSDVRVKKNIKPIDDALDKVLKLEGVYYTRTDIEDESEKIGVIAQEIQQVLPQVVIESDGGILGVSYGNITAVLIEAIKELSQQNRGQQEEIYSLKRQIASVLQSTNLNGRI